VTRRSPSLGLFLAEGPRAFQEATATLVAAPLLSRLPRADGGPVLVLPGLMTGDVNTSALRWWLRRAGSEAHTWDLGLNVGPVRRVEQGLSRRLLELSDAAGGQVSLVGWSLGGIFARALARRHPEAVRQVVTLGSPFRRRSAVARQTPANLVYESLGRFHVPGSDLVVFETSDEPVPVPATAVYSRSDGVAPWQTCLDVVSPTAENIRVRSSHVGMPVHPAVLYAVADRLAQPGGAWAPFDPPPSLRPLYPPAVTWSPRHPPSAD
jgi:pimeloyl-ACP methyl ester carboxylesterase